MTEAEHPTITGTPAKHGHGGVFAVHCRAWRLAAGLGLSLAVLLLLPRPAAAVGSVLFACSRTGPGVVAHQADLPPALRTALRQAVPYEMADPGQRFQVTDVIGPGPRLPSHRMICAYPDGDGFVVEWESGGIAHRRGRSAFRRVGTAYEPR